VVFTVSAAVLLIGSVIVGALARGELPSLAVAASARGAQGSTRLAGQSS